VWSVPRPSRFIPGKRPVSHCTGDLGWPRDRSGRDRKISLDSVHLVERSYVWRATVNMATNHRVPQSAGNSSTSWGTTTSTRRTLWTSLLSWCSRNSRVGTCEIFEFYVIRDKRSLRTVINRHLKTRRQPYLAWSTSQPVYSCRHSDGVRWTNHCESCV
jgi:hypothetical protein